MKDVLCVSRVLLLFSIAIAGPSRSGFALVIDDFSVGPVSLTGALYETVSDLSIGLDPAHVAGAGRFITFNAIDGYPWGDTGSVTVEVDTSGTGALRHLPDTGLSAANFYVTYGNTSVGTTSGETSGCTHVEPSECLPPMSLDLLSDGADRFAFSFSYTLPNPGQYPRFAMGLALWSGNSEGSYVFRILPSSNTPFVFEIPFEDILAVNPVLDLTDIRNISFGTSNGTMQGQFELTEVITRSGAAADFTGEGRVDGADFLTLQRNFGSGTTHAEGDANEDGSVDGQDLSIWEHQYGWEDSIALAPVAEPTSALAVVPEPTSFTLALLGLCLARVRRPR